MIKSAKLLLFGAAACSLVAASPAAAAVVILATNVDLTSGPFTFGVNETDTFIFSSQLREQFDPSPVLVSTTGTAAVTAIFGTPSVFFTNPSVTFGPNTFPGFSSVADPTRAPFSVTASDLGLRYSVDGQDFFGFARFDGSTLFSVGFETVANTPILAGAPGTVGVVPEPGTWALMILGFGFVGGAMRSAKVRKKMTVSYA